jgi:hypothetical protein
MADWWCVVDVVRKREANKSAVGATTRLIVDWIDDDWQARMRGMSETDSCGFIPTKLQFRFNQTSIQTRLRSILRIHNLSLFTSIHIDSLYSFQVIINVSSVESWSRLRCIITRSREGKRRLQSGNMIE